MPRKQHAESARVAKSTPKPKQAPSADYHENLSMTQMYKQAAAVSSTPAAQHSPTPATPTPSAQAHHQQRPSYSAQQTPGGPQYNAQPPVSTAKQPPMMTSNQGQHQNMPAYGTPASPYYPGHQSGQHPSQHVPPAAQHQYAQQQAQAHQTPAQYAQARQPPYGTPGGAHHVKMPQQPAQYPNYQPSPQYPYQNAQDNHPPAPPVYPHGTPMKPSWGHPAQHPSHGVPGRPSDENRHAPASIVPPPGFMEKLPESLHGFFEGPNGPVIYADPPRVLQATTTIRPGPPHSVEYALVADKITEKEKKRLEDQRAEKMAAIKRQQEEAVKAEQMAKERIRRACLDFTKSLINGPPR